MHEEARTDDRTLAERGPVLCQAQRLGLLHLCPSHSTPIGTPLSIELPDTLESPRKPALRRLIVRLSQCLLGGVWHTQGCWEMQSILRPAVPLPSFAVYGDIMDWGLKGQPWSGKASELEVLPGTDNNPLQASWTPRTDLPAPLGPKMWGLLFKILCRGSKAQVAFQELGIPARSSWPAVLFTPF